MPMIIIPNASTCKNLYESCITSETILSAAFSYFGTNSWNLGDSRQIGVHNEEDDYI